MGVGRSKGKGCYDYPDDFYLVPPILSDVMGLAGRVLGVARDGTAGNSVVVCGCSSRDATPHPSVCTAPNNKKLPVIGVVQDVAEFASRMAQHLDEEAGRTTTCTQSAVFNLTHALPNNSGVISSAKATRCGACRLACGVR